MEGDGGSMVVDMEVCRERDGEGLWGFFGNGVVV